MLVQDQPPVLAPRHIELTGENAALLDSRVLAQYSELSPWGLATSIDLGGCNPQSIRDSGNIERFVVALCELIEMKRFGDPVVVRFGEDPRVSGYSLVQLIETSLISGHFADQTNGAFIDIFSCKAYPPYRTALFCREWFGAQTIRVSGTYRGTETAELSIPALDSL